METKYELDYQDQYYNSYFYRSDDNAVYFNDSNIIYKKVSNEIVPVYNFFEQHQVYSTQSFCCGYKDYLYSIVAYPAEIENKNYSAYLARIKNDGSDFEIIEEVTPHFSNPKSLHIIDDKIYLYLSGEDSKTELKTYQIKDTGVSAINEENSIFNNNYEYLIHKYPFLKENQLLSNNAVFHLIKNKLYLQDYQYLYEIDLDNQETKSYELRDLIPKNSHIFNFDLINNEWYIQGNQDIFKIDLALENKNIFIPASQREIRRLKI